MSRIIGVLIMALLLISVTVAAEDWKYVTVDDEGNAGTGTFLWLDSLDNPNIVYQIGDAVFHSRWTAAGWVRIGSLMGGRCIAGALAADSVVHVVVSGTHYTHNHVNYGYLDGTGWHIETVNTSYGTEGVALSITTDGNNLPHIAFASGADLVHLYQDSITGNWRQEVAVSGSDAKVYYKHPIAIDGDNNIYIAYYSSQNHLKMAFFNGVSWGAEYIDQSADNNGGFCDMVLDSSGVPHISYYDATNSRLKYATWSSIPKALTESQE